MNNILLIGNGFDLHHKLPTSYRNFLDFLKILLECKSFKYRHNLESFLHNLSNHDNESFKSLIEAMNNNINSDISYANKLIEEFNAITKLINHNVWYDYFSEILSENGGWIDLEKEISNIIKLLDNFPINQFEDIKDYKTTFDNIMFKYLNYLEYLYVEYKTKELPSNIEQYILKNKLYDKGLNKIATGTKNNQGLIKLILLWHLNNFIECLNFYLSLCQTINIKKLSLLNELISNCGENLYCINFNYTNTLKLYGIEENNIHYIHGKINDNYKDNNIVLGIDEYVPNSELANNIDFLEFKKYFQRIYKKTGNKYKDWTTNRFNAFEKDLKYNGTAIINGEPKIKLFIFGHSLDVTDKDILFELINSNYVKTTVYFRNKNEYKKKIINLVKILGKDRIIEKTGNDSLIFEKFDDGIEINRTTEVMYKVTG